MEVKDEYVPTTEPDEILEIMGLEYLKTISSYEEALDGIKRRISEKIFNKYFTE